ncbi:hypothetical protein [Methylobacterium sp. CM6246]
MLSPVSNSTERHKATLFYHRPEGSVGVSVRREALLPFGAAARHVNDRQLPEVLRAAQQGPDETEEESTSYKELQERRHGLTDAAADLPATLENIAVVAFAVASEYRADLAAAGMGEGRYGFDLGLDVRLAPSVSHVVEVRRLADGALVCAKQVNAAGAWTALLAA